MTKFIEVKTSEYRCVSINIKHIGGFFPCSEKGYGTTITTVQDKPFDVLNVLESYEEVKSMVEK